MASVLTDATIRTAKPKDKPYKLYDGGGLFLLVTPSKKDGLTKNGKKLPPASGGKWWRFKYRFGGKEKLLSFGTYPEISLVSAREKRDAARKQIAEGIDPGMERKAVKGAESLTGSFEVVAREWYERRKKDWSESHAKRTLRQLERDVFPFVGALPISEITSPAMLTVLQRVEGRTLETAHKIKISCSQIFRYAIATGRAMFDPTEALRGALATIHNKRMAAPTSPEMVAPLLRALNGYQGTFVVKCALRLAPMLFVRPGELRKAEWAEMDFDRAEWRIPIERMKRRQTEKKARQGEVAHIVPLPRQAVAILQDLHQLTGNGRYVFPSHRSEERPMCDNAVNAALRRMGFGKDEIVSHGFRHMASTLLHEMGFSSHLIEKQLSHADRNRIRAVYNQAEYLPERRKMMQSWADYLDMLATDEENKATPIRATR